MTQIPTDPIKFYGTDQPVTPPRLLRAGALTAEFDAGSLRHIRIGGVEVIRGVAFIVRDKDWGTYNPMIHDLAIEETGSAFTVTYRAVAKDAIQEFRFDARITGSTRGLDFACNGEAVTDLLTNRTGFVVLHPIAGVAGHPVTIEHTDGTIEQSYFPAQIDPVQPMRDVRALTHDAAPGLRVTCRMEGDDFEMEDQRNWTDASFKTYVRPLALPWPYVIGAGTSLKQSVLITVSGAAPRDGTQDAAVSIRLGDALGPAPAVGLGFDPEETGATQAVSATLAMIGAQHLICHFDPSRGHDRASLAGALGVAAAIGARPWLEAVISGVEEFEQEIEALGALVAELGTPFEVVLLSHLADLKCTLPGSVWPPTPSPIEMVRAARQAFPGARIGGGMFSFFTEFNRKRPPVTALDLVGFTTAALVHAGDDQSAMEGLESIPAIAASARTIAAGRPITVGPSAIGLRMNPYGAAPMENPANIRQAMNRNDPRQRGLLGAAWAVGYYAALANTVTAIAFGGTTGPFGLVHTGQSWPCPWYDRHGGVYPAFHVVRLLARFAGRTLRAVTASEPNAVACVCIGDANAGFEVLLANLTPNPQSIVLPAPAKSLCILDAAKFVTAAETPEFMDRHLLPADTSHLTLGAFALARIILA